MIEPDASIGPYVVFGPGVTVRQGCARSAPSATSRAPRSARAPSSARSRGFAAGRKLDDGVHIGNFVEVKNAHLENGRQSQSPHLYRRCACGRARQYRRRHHHLQLRRRQQAPHRDRRGRLHRLEHGAGGARQDRRRRLSSRRARVITEEVAAERARARPRPPGHQSRAAPTRIRARNKARKKRTPERCAASSALPERATSRP